MTAAAGRRQEAGVQALSNGSRRDGGQVFCDFLCFLCLFHVFLFFFVCCLYLLVSDVRSHWDSLGLIDIN